MAKKDTASMLASLRKSATRVEAKPVKTSHPKMDLPEDIQQLFISAIGTANLYKIVESKKNVEYDLVKERAFEFFLQRMWECKTRQPSISMESFLDGKPDCSALFTVKATYKVEVPAGEFEIDEDSELHEIAQKLVLLLTQMGFKKNMAERIVVENIDVVQEVCVRPANELEKGHYTQDKQWIPATPSEQKIASKVLSYLTAVPVKGNSVYVEALTEEEKAIAVQVKDKIVVKQGFLDRVCGYCNGIKQLSMLLKVVKPQLAISQPKFAISDNEEEKIDRLRNVFEEVVGSTDLNIVIGGTNAA